MATVTNRTLNTATIANVQIVSFNLLIEGAYKLLIDADNYLVIDFTGIGATNRALNTASMTNNAIH